MSNKQKLGMALSLVFSLSLTADLAVAQTSGGGSRRLAVSWDDPVSGAGSVQALELRAPWDFVTPVLATGSQAIVRSADGNVYAASQVDDTITVIDADQWVITNTFALEPGSGLQDIAIVANDTAYVTRGNATHLGRLDLDTGSTTDIVDLSVFADANGIFEMGMMAIQGGNLFIQIRRSDPFKGPPPLLAVMDIATEQLIDVDPQTPGIQAIELQGTTPKLKMKTAQGQSRLFVSATGGFFDAGGIEEIDTVQLQSLGLIFPERAGQTGADLTTFVFTRPDRGFLVFTTDLTISSHFVAFTLAGGVELPPPIGARLDYTASVLTFDRPSGAVFYPDGPAPNAGVLVLDSMTGLPLREPAVPTAATPNDFAIVLPSGAFE